MTTLNLFSATTLQGKTAYSTLSTTMANVLVNSINSNTAYKVNDIMISNTSSGTLTANINILRGTTTYNLISNIAVPGNSMFVIIGKDTPMYLEENDSLQGSANVGSVVTMICSYEYMS